VHSGKPRRVDLYLLQSRDDGLKISNKITMLEQLYFDYRYQHDPSGQLRAVLTRRFPIERIDGIVVLGLVARTPVDNF
jgi:hypothetical protein